MQFAEGVRNYYRRHYPLTEAARSIVNLNPGNGNVSRLCHEPRVSSRRHRGHAGALVQQRAAGNLAPPRPGQR